MSSSSIGQLGPDAFQGLIEAVQSKLTFGGAPPGEEVVDSLAIEFQKSINMDGANEMGMDECRRVIKILTGLKVSENQAPAPNGAAAATTSYPAASSVQPPPAQSNNGNSNHYNNSDTPPSSCPLSPPAFRSGGKPPSMTPKVSAPGQSPTSPLHQSNNRGRSPNRSKQQQQGQQVRQSRSRTPTGRSVGRFGRVFGGGGASGAKPPTPVVQQRRQRSHSKTRSRVNVRSKSPIRSRSPFNRRAYESLAPMEEDVLNGDNQHAERRGTTATTTATMPSSSSTSSPNVFHDAHATEESMQCTNTTMKTSVITSPLGAFATTFQQQQQQKQQQQQQQTQSSFVGAGGRPPLSSPVHTTVNAATTANASSSPQKRGATGPTILSPAFKRPEVPQNETRTEWAPSDNGVGGGGDDDDDKMDVGGLTFDVLEMKGEMFSPGTAPVGTSPSPRKVGTPGALKSPSRRNRRSTPRRHQGRPAHARSSPMESTPAPDEGNFSMSGMSDILFTPLTDDGTASETPQSASPFHIFSRLSMDGGTKGTPTATGIPLLHSHNLPAGGAPFASPPAQAPVPAQTGMGWRQTAPHSMAAGIAAAAVAASVGFASSNTNPTTPTFGGPSFGASASTSAAPQTVQTSRPKKKECNMATPAMGGSDQPRFEFKIDKQKPAVGETVPQFNLGTAGGDKGKGGKSKPRFTIRGGSKNDNHAQGRIPQVLTDDTSPTASDLTGDSNPFPSEFRSSPSNASTGEMSIDSPFPDHQRQPQQQYSQLHDRGVSTTTPPIGEFALGAGGGKTSVAAGARIRGHKNGIRRGQKIRSASVSIRNGGVTSDLTGNKAMIHAKREFGKQAFQEHDYRKSIEVYTDAIKLYTEHFSFEQSKDLLAVLLSNRAAALLMVGANQAAADDCTQAVQYISDPSVPVNVPGVTPLLRPKCYNRRARAFLKLGLVEDAQRAFSKAIGSADGILDGLQRPGNTVQLQASDQHALDTIKAEAIIGMSDASRLSKSRDEIKDIIGQLPTMSRRLKKDAAINALNKINDALQKASDCTELHEQQVKLLASMKRWREVASHCERYAASKVRCDGCFFGDLASKNPFPRVSQAEALTVDFFGDAREDTLEGAKLVLSRLACGEAVLRLPPSIQGTYCRALRLEERYQCSTQCLMAIQNNGVVYPWLFEEARKVEQTKKEKDKGDAFFRKGEFERASAQYYTCLLIDFEGESDDFVVDGKNAGGRLHAVLHCNRVACLMAVHRYNDALAECTSALRVHPRYMKAVLRRARCYSRLDRHEEAEAEFRRYLTLVREAQENPDFFSPLLTPCLFDLPHDVSEKDENHTRQELDDVHKAKTRAEAAERSRNAYRQQQWQSERFNFTGDAQRRRDYFQSHQSSSRRWDSFNNGGPGPNAKSSRTNSSQQNSGSGTGRGSQQQDQSRSNNGNSRSNRTGYTNAAPENSNCHYFVLGVPPTATEAVIKKAYRKLALQCHPDKGGDPEKFKRISEANQVLSDVVERRKYDRENGRRPRY